MAQIKFGAGIVGMSGKIGGTVFAKNRSGSYARAWSKPVKPASELQQQRKNAITTLSQYWSNSMTDGEREAFRTYAAAVPSVNRLGEQVFNTGMNHFMRINSIRTICGLTPLKVAPSTLTLPEVDSTMAVVCDAKDQTITVTFDEALPWYLEEDSRLVLFMGRPQNGSRKFFAGPYKFLHALDKDDESGEKLAAPMTIVEGQKIYVQARILREDGRLSNPFRTSIIAVDTTV